MNHKDDTEPIVSLPVHIFDSIIYLVLKTNSLETFHLLVHLFLFG